MHGTGRDRGSGGHTPRRGRAVSDMRPAQRTHGRASQRIVEKLRLLIRQGQIASGDRLPAERELCEQYGVSRVTIREALRVLEASGLVDIRLGSHGGAFVTSPTAERTAGSVDDYLALSAVTPREIHETRTILELGLVPLACERADEEDLERLGHAYSALVRAWQGGRDARREVHDFHLQLARAASNAAAEVLLRPLYDMSGHAPDHAAGRPDSANREGARQETASAAAGAEPEGDFEGDFEGKSESKSEAGPGAAAPPVTAQRDIDDHRRLLDAVRDRDAPRASAALRAHIERNEPQ